MHNKSKLVMDFFISLVDTACQYLYYKCFLLTWPKIIKKKYIKLIEYWGIYILVVIYKNFNIIRLYIYYDLLVQNNENFVDQITRLYDELNVIELDDYDSACFVFVLFHFMFFKVLFSVLWLCCSSLYILI